MQTLPPCNENNVIVGRFGRRKVAPRACVADGKPHIRNFLREALQELGFIACDCDPSGAIRPRLDEIQPDLILLGLSGGGIEGSNMLEALAAAEFDGKVLVFGPRASPMVTAILGIGEELGLSMLPLLPTPFNDADLRARVAALLPAEAPPEPPVDVAEALHAGWLELWYQPKIEIRSLTMHGAEALIRMRHPTWGTVPPAYFIPGCHDPSFAALSDFVIDRAVRDWFYFVGECGPVELAVNLPAAALRDPAAIDNLCRSMPKHPAFEGLIVEIDSAQLIKDLPLAKAITRRLQLHNIGVAIDDLGTDWPLLMELDEFPFVEIKVERDFVSGCGSDRLKMSTCRRIVELADTVGARTVAKGVETRADFLGAREAGFDLIQGFYFAKPMEPQKFVRTVLNRPLEAAR
jgi:EAL domain-containing protein (putative c-di-GMP-specific phosphodiesterase class I)